MMQRLLHRLEGQVRVRVECPFPERVLNVCGARGLAFWDLVWEAPDVFTCRLSRRDYHTLERAAGPLECTLSVVRREGAPYFLLRFRHRQALLVGLTLCAAALFLGSFFVWDFRVEGNRTVPTETILRALEKQGVGLGAFGLSLDGERIRNHVLLDVPELSWITVNVSGCRATVQVVERRTVPELLDRRVPRNVTARRGGLVLRIQALGGTPCVLRGASVTEGQLLISGVEDTETFGARIVSGMGTVTARTWYDLTANVPLTAPEKRYTGEERTGRSLIFGTHRIKLFRNSSIAGRSYDKITERTQWSLFGIPLPLAAELERFRFYETEAAAQPEEALRQRAGDAMAAYLEDLVAPYGSVTASQVTARRRGGVLTVTLRAECVEEIGRSVPVYTEKDPG